MNLKIRSIRMLCPAALAAIVLTCPAVPASAEGVSYSAGIDVASQYFFRGIMQEDTGFIGQPWAEANLGNIYSGSDGDLISSINLTLGTWNSLHSEQTGTDETWYEADLYAAAEINDGAYTLTYTHYNSPSAAFEDVQEIQVSFAGPSLGGLEPTVAIGFETKGAADAGDEGVYIQISAEHVLSESENMTVTIPITLGLSGDDYYESPVDGDDDTFGFLEVGMMFNSSLGDNWDITAGPALLFLGDTAEEFNDGDDSDFEIIGKLSVSTSF
jgi:hypothetical protein